MKNPRKDLSDFPEELSHPIKTEEKTVDKGLTQKQKKILGETKRRHDKALRRLAQM